MGLYSKANQATPSAKQGGLLYKTSRILAEEGASTGPATGIKPALLNAIKSLIDRKHAFFIIKMSLAGLIKDIGGQYTKEDKAAFGNNVAKFYKTLFQDLASVWEPNGQSLLALVDSENLFDPDHLLHQVMHATRTKYENVADELTWNLFKDVRTYGPEVGDIESWIADLL
jgi:hypothetical protein